MRLTYLQAREILRREIANNMSFLSTMIKYTDKDNYSAVINALNYKFYGSEKYLQYHPHLDYMTLDNMYAYNLYLCNFVYTLNGNRVEKKNADMYVNRCIRNMYSSTMYFNSVPKNTYLPNVYPEPKTCGDITGYHLQNSRFDKTPVKLKKEMELIDEPTYNQILSNALINHRDNPDTYISKCVHDEYIKLLKYVNANMASYTRAMFTNPKNTCYRNTTTFDINDKTVVEQDTERRQKLNDSFPIDYKLVSFINGTLYHDKALKGLATLSVTTTMDASYKFTSALVDSLSNVDSDKLDTLIAHPLYASKLKECVSSHDISMLQSIVNSSLDFVSSTASALNQDKDILNKIANQDDVKFLTQKIHNDFSDSVLGQDLTKKG